MMPVLFISHGSPMLAVTDGPAHRFLRGLAGSLPRPEAVVVLSAHWETSQPAVGFAEAPETIHDFYGFEDRLYRLTYPAPGAPDVAQAVVAALCAAGLPAEADPARGLDHGAWVPLSLIWPGAGIPVVPVSIQPHRTAHWHLKLGAALAPLRKRGVMIIGSGAITHNLRALSRHDQDGPALDWVSRFTEWTAEQVTAGDSEALCRWVAHPDALRNHPSPDHYLPLFAAIGAAEATGDAKGQRLHDSVTYGALAMDVFRFG